MDYGQSVVSEQTAVASGSLQTAESSAPAQQTDSAAGKAAAKQQNRVTTNRACDNCRRRKVRCLPGFEDTVCAHTSRPGRFAAMPSEGRTGLRVHSQSKPAPCVPPREYRVSSR